MKKLLPILLFALSFTGCQAQFANVEPREPKRISATAVVKHTSDTGSLLVGERLSFQVGEPLELNVEYHVILELPHHFDHRKVINAALLDFRISEDQARRDILKMMEDHQMPVPATK